MSEKNVNQTKSEETRKAITLPMGNTLPTGKAPDEQPTIPESTGEIEKVRLADIDLESDGAKIYDYRSDRTDEEVEKLAESIKSNGLLHPPAVIRDHDGGLIPFFGFGRFHALKKLGVDEIEVKVFADDELPEDKRINIIFAENSDRNGLTPLDKARHLYIAKKRLEISDEEMAGRFGKKTGIEKPVTVNKYIKLAKVFFSGESEELMDDLKKEIVQFGLVVDVLATMKNAGERNAFYRQVIKPLKPIREKALLIKRRLDQRKSESQSLNDVIASETVQSVLEKAKASKANKAEVFLDELRLLDKHLPTEHKKTLENVIEGIRVKYYGDSAVKDDFDILLSKDREKNEMYLRTKIKLDYFQESLDTIIKMSREDEGLKQLEELIVSP
jgi:ParB family chromosome partitioning protein